MSEKKKNNEDLAAPEIIDDDHSLTDALLGALALLSVVGIGSGYLVGKFVSRNNARGISFRIYPLSHFIYLLFVPQMINTYASSQEREQTGEVLPNNVLANFTKEMFPAEVAKPTNKIVPDAITSTSQQSVPPPPTTNTPITTDAPSATPVTAEVAAPGYKKFRRRMAPGTDQPLEVPEPHLPRARASGKPTNPELIKLGMRNARWALFWGTLIACSGFAAGTYATCWYMDVWTIRDFARRMKRIVPDKIEEHKNLMENATEASSTMRRLFKDTYLQKLMAKTPKDPDNITEQEFESAVDGFLNMYIDIRDLLPFLRWFSRSKNENTTQTDSTKTADSSSSVQIENIPSTHSNQPLIVPAASEASLSTEVPADAPMPVGWGQWLWDGVWYPYYWATGSRK